MMTTFFRDFKSHHHHTFLYKYQDPSQPATAIIVLSGENSMLVMRTVLRWTYQNSVDNYAKLDYYKKGQGY